MSQICGTDACQFYCCLNVDYVLTVDVQQEVDALTTHHITKLAVQRVDLKQKQQELSHLSEQAERTKLELEVLQEMLSQEAKGALDIVAANVSGTQTVIKITKIDGRGH
jgi:Skp family chaperone for outer membrane proteins